MYLCIGNEHNEFIMLQEEYVEEANLWAKSASKGLIIEVLKTKHLNDFAAVISANALYFMDHMKVIKLLKFDMELEKTIKRSLCLFSFQMKKMDCLVY